MGKCTVVSTLPFGLSEDKYGLIPFRYLIPPAPKEGISVLVVQDGYHMYQIPLSDDKAPPMKIVDLAEKIAEGLCADYIGANLAVNYEVLENGAISAPGLFWLEGALSVVQVTAGYGDRVKQARNNTMAWFQNLVKIADDDWSKTHQHRTITDLQRSACRNLGLEREWNFNVFDMTLTLCWACKTSVNPTAIICSGCKSILNIDEYNKNKHRFVTA